METIMSSIKKKEFIIGLLSVLLVITALASAFYKAPIDKNQKTLAENKSKIISPVATVQESKKTISPSLVPTINKIKEIKQLADTSGTYSEVVRNGDNFWKISKRVCGNGRYYLSIQATNGYLNRSLQPGDIISVDCTE